jgi:hypothetical protein
MKPISFPKNTRNFYRENLCSVALPSGILFDSVDSKAFNRKDLKNPLNFQHFRIYPAFNFRMNPLIFHASLLKTNYAANYTEAYFSHFPEVNKTISDSGSIINRNDFANGLALYAFELSADLCKQRHFNLIKSKNLRMILNFDSDTVVNIVCIVYFEYQKMIEINKNIQSKLDYSIK